MLKYRLASRGLYAVVALLILSRPFLLASETIPGEPNIAWVKSLFSILPDTTETVVVMGPYQYERLESDTVKASIEVTPGKYEPMESGTLRPDGEASLRFRNRPLPPVSVSRLAFESNLSFFTCHPVLKQFVESQPIALSVWGFRPVTFKVEFPGGTWAESCQLLVPENEIPEVIASLFRTAKKRIAGHAVVEGSTYDPLIQQQINQPGGPQVMAPQGYRPPEKEDTQGHLFFAMPTQRLLIATNSETQLTSVLEALSKPSAERTGFAYPADLPGAPRIWGLRRYGAQYTQAGPTATTHADYLMCIADSAAGRIEFRLKTSDARAPSEFATVWGELGGAKLRMAPAGPELISGSLSTTNNGIWLGVIMMLGIVVLL